MLLLVSNKIHSLFPSSSPHSFTISFSLSFSAIINLKKYPHSHPHHSHSLHLICTLSQLKLSINSYFPHSHWNYLHFSTYLYPNSQLFHSANNSRSFFTFNNLTFSKHILSLSSSPHFISFFQFLIFTLSHAQPSTFTGYLSFSTLALSFFTSLSVPSIIFKSFFLNFLSKVHRFSIKNLLGVTFCMVSCRFL